MFLGVDFGTSVVKATVVDRDGRLRRTAARGWTELTASTPQTTAAWWSAFVTLVDDLRRSGARIDRIEGVAVSGTTPTVCLRWADGTTSPVATYKDDPAPLRKSLRRRAGATLLTTAGFINHALTGEPSIDAVSRFELGRSWTADTVAGAGHQRADWFASIVPRGVSVLETIGRVTRDASRATGLKAGTPVCAGTTDFVASLVGSGAATSGDAMLMYGTFGSWLDLDVPLVELLYASAIYQPPYTWRASLPSFGTQIRAIAAALAAAGDPQQALANLDDLAARSPVGSNGVTFVPYEHLLDPRVADHPRGTFFGMTASAVSSDLARAALESFGFSLRFVGARTRQRISDRRVFAAGGGSRSDFWVGMTSAILEHRQHRRAGAAGALGTALIALLSQRALSATRAAALVRACVPSVAVRVDRARGYDAAYRRFTEHVMG